ncbi:MAG: L-glutamate gamma-semialdehyde dehydrogenase [Planctomycetes bacterium]|nr:L-glutamate gamma-semialdehyde dehydrogenase [Planctomycetota bacterium]
MSNAIARVPTPRNEPVRSYAPGSPERVELAAALRALRASPTEIPVQVGGRDLATAKTFEQVEPHAHKRVLATCHAADASHVQQAVDAARAAAPGWAAMSFDDRASIFLRAADLLAGPWRARVNAATMLGQSKTCFQAEIDAACELIDFFRFNVAYARQILELQPESAPGLWNRCEYRNLEGFVFAVTPFNFTSIAGNLPTAPALMGNVCLWKPASTSVLSNWLLMQLLREAGLPDGVIAFLPGSGATVGDPVLSQPELAGVHFTGSTGVFHSMWKAIGENIANYKSYPRLVGETGGKDFVFAHPSADVDALAVALLRGAFEYQGQKCSAASRAYVPRSLADALRERLVAEVSAISMGDPTDFTHFMAAVIDAKSFEKCKRYIDGARADPAASILVGGECDDSTGWFVQPTIIETADPMAPSMCEEIFGPILTLYVYEDGKLDETLALCDATSPYALTGAVFARDRQAVAHMAARLRQAAGNFYVNDKPTGAVVGQQPFGGARASGTNDKAGSLLNLIRWTSVRTIKETFVPPTDWRYPHMQEG